MSVVQEGNTLLRSQTCRPDVSSLRRELLSARRELLLQASDWASLHVARKMSEDVPGLPCLSQRWSIEDAMVEHASADLRQVERALNCMLEASYGVCRECRKDIPLSRLRREPLAALCIGCIEGRLESLASDAL